MEKSLMLDDNVNDEEHVLLDLDSVFGHIDIPPNAPYVLSGLDTLNPILTIDGKFKLIGEYEETIGTCFVFTEKEGAPMVHEETGPSEANLFSGKCIIDPNHAASKQVEPIARLHKILKFRLLLDDENDQGDQDATAHPANINVNDSDQDAAAHPANVNVNDSLT